MSVYTAVCKDLQSLPSELANSAEAEAALLLAHNLDEGTFQSAAPLVRELRDTMDSLRKRADGRMGEKSELDKQRERRAARKAGGA